MFRMLRVSEIYALLLPSHDVCQRCIRFIAYFFDSSSSCSCLSSSIFFLFLPDYHYHYLIPVFSTLRAFNVGIAWGLGVRPPVNVFTPSPSCACLFVLGVRCNPCLQNYDAIYYLAAVRYVHSTAVCLSRAPNPYPNHSCRFLEFLSVRIKKHFDTRLPQFFSLPKYSIEFLLSRVEYL